MEVIFICISKIILYIFMISYAKLVHSGFTSI